MSVLYDRSWNRYALRYTGIAPSGLRPREYPSSSDGNPALKPASDGRNPSAFQRNSCVDLPVSSCPYRKNRKNQTHRCHTERKRGHFLDRPFSAAAPWKVSPILAGSTTDLLREKTLYRRLSRDRPACPFSLPLRAYPELDRRGWRRTEDHNGHGFCGRKNLRLCRPLSERNYPFQGRAAIV